MEPRISLITLGVMDLERSLKFYRDGLGFRTSGKIEDGVIFFKTRGTILVLYPYENLADDVSGEFNVPRSKFSGFTLAHNVRKQSEVDELILEASKAGAKIEKMPQSTFWGGYSGYFSDPDGYLWEVAYGAFPFNEDGSLQIP